ncbi:RING-H2 finger protein ATL7 [Apostasia shenzhenica]|uniref:RING-type E3 ubiquitin transferase n=1 Tax=Apostasia shenzhenica TaxID=1088818 RepID=A0A2H9ZZP1_9ASPA|nr:RING-H2 finger protein ATL7 [Apostasia shenzhenica]
MLGIHSICPGSRLRNPSVAEHSTSPRRRPARYIPNNSTIKLRTIMAVNEILSGVSANLADILEIPIARPEERNADDRCSICLEEFAGGGEELRVLPRCGHFFHRECVDPWFEKSLRCPMCRTSVIEIDNPAGAPRTSPPPADLPPANPIFEHVALVYNYLMMLHLGP